MRVWGYRGVTSGLTSEAHEVSRSDFFINAAITTRIKIVRPILTLFLDYTPSLDPHCSF